jgi:rare lipoprotein A
MRLTSCRWLLFVLALSACHNAPSSTFPGVKIGKPYVIDGKTYYPEYDPTYDKIGQASWYGPGFHGRNTANGELFNQNDLTAAHPTLPMPSMVRVTNLENGKSVIVRVNDRGPFKSNRIIDLSKKAAEQIGMRSMAQVRVQFLKAETEEYIASRDGGDSKAATMVAMNREAENTKTASIEQSTEPQIVEATDTSTHAGQTVSAAAPVMTVSSDNLEGSQPVSGQPAAVETADAGMEDNVMPLVRGDAAPKPQAIEAKEVPQPKVVAEEAPKPLVAPRPTATAAHGYMIQAGSFASEQNAHKLDTQLSAVGKPSIDKIEMNGKTWWRARLGPFADQPAAASALAQVRAAGLPDARIISQ